MGRPVRFSLPTKRVTEIRIHGVGGTPPEAMLDDPHPEQVAGDSKAGFFRRRVETADRHVEAYSWGGLTSRSVFRSLWLLLLPFTLTNVAGWMVEIDHTKGRAERQKHAEAQERLIRVIAALLTAGFVAWAGALVVDVLAYQCGGDRLCREGHWWLEFLGNLQRRVGLRIFVGVGVVLLVFALLDRLAKRTRSDYDEYETPVLREATLEKEAGEQANLADPAFWYRPSLVRDLMWLHRACVLLMLGAAVAHTFWVLAPVGHRDLLKALWLVEGMGATIAALSTAFLRRERSESDERSRRPWGPVALSIAGFFSLVGLFVYAWLQSGLTKKVSHLDAFSSLPFLIFAVAIVLTLVVVAIQIGWWVSQSLRSGSREAKRSLSARLTAMIPLVLAVLLVASRDGRVVFIALAFTGGILLAQREFAFFSVSLVAAVMVAWVLALAGWNLWIVVATGLTVTWWAVGAEATWPADAFRWGGMAVMPLVATFLLAGAFVGTAIRLVDFLNGDEVEGLGDLALPQAYDWFAVAFASALFLTAFAAIVLYTRCRQQSGSLTVPVPTYPQLDRPANAVELDENRLKDAEKNIARSISVVRLARSGDLFFTCLAALTLIGALLAIVVVTDGRPWSGSINDLLDHEPQFPEDWAWLRGAASWLLASLPILLVFLFRQTATNEGARRRLGVLWDLGAFWPRRFHPFAPPAYTERAIPELGQRISDATTYGEKVMLLAHSQGSVIVFATLVSMEEEELTNVAVATYGSPLAAFFRRFFPTYFSSAAFDELAGKLATSENDLANARRWNNFYRWTDPIAAPIFSTMFNDPPSGPVNEGAVPSRDLVLFDPWWWWDVPGQPIPSPLGHSDYLEDPVITNWIDTQWSPGTQEGS